MMISLKMGWLAFTVVQAAETSATLFAKGKNAWDNGNTDKAVELFKASLDRDQSNVDAHVWLGRGYTIQLKTASVFRKPILASRALAEFTKAVNLDPRNIDAREARAEYYVYAPSIAGGGADKARNEAETAKRLDPYRGGLLAARTAERLKDAARAEKEYRLVMSSYPDSATPISSLAGFLGNQRRWNEAFDLIDKSRARFPDSYDLLYTFGRAAALSGERLSEGEAALRKYLDRPLPHEGGDAVARWRLAALLERKGEIAQARTEYSVALRLDPRNEDAKRALTRLAGK